MDFCNDYVSQVIEMDLRVYSERSGIVSIEAMARGRTQRQKNRDETEDRSGPFRVILATCLRPARFPFKLNRLLTMQ